MMTGRRTTALVLALAFGMCVVAAAPSDVRPTAGQKYQKLRSKQRGRLRRRGGQRRRRQTCEDLRARQRARFVDRRLGKRLGKKRKRGRLTKCANKTIEKGTDPLVCLTSPKTQGKIKIKEKKCSVAALAEKGVTGRDCSDLNSQCTGVVSDAASLATCLQCALTNSSNCLVAIEYGLSTERCFGSDGGGS